MLTSSVVDCGLERWLDKMKDYKIGMRCFSAKHALSWNKSKDQLSRNRNNVSEWSNMFTRWLLVQQASTIKI
jgi:hypothetical protein